MRGRSRTRRTLKWAGTVLSVLFVLLFLASGRWGITLQHGWAWVGICAGRIVAQDVRVLKREYFRCDVVTHSQGLRHWNEVRFYHGYRYNSITLPIWVLFVLVAIPTSFLWWRDRRVPAGHCQHCGYDLTGNVSGRCPECGEPA